MKETPHCITTKLTIVSYNMGVNIPYQPSAMVAKMLKRLPHLEEGVGKGIGVVLKERVCPLTGTRARNVAAAVVRVVIGAAADVVAPLGARRLLLLPVLIFRDEYHMIDVCMRPSCKAASLCLRSPSPHHK